MRVLLLTSLLQRRFGPSCLPRPVFLGSGTHGPAVRVKNACPAHDRGPNNFRAHSNCAYPANSRGLLSKADRHGWACVSSMGPMWYDTIMSPFSIPSTCAVYAVCMQRTVEMFTMCAATSCEIGRNLQHERCHETRTGNVM